MINGMYIYALNGNVAGKKRYDLTGATQFKTPIYATGEVAFGIKTYDKINGAENWDGIYNIKVYANNDLIFEFKPINLVLIKRATSIALRIMRNT